MTTVTNEAPRGRNRAVSRGQLRFPSPAERERASSRRLEGKGTFRWRFMPLSLSPPRRDEGIMESAQLCCAVSERPHKPSFNKVESVSHSGRHAAIHVVKLD